MRRFALLIVFGCLAGCVTPSIPIPPPDPALMTFHVTLVDTVSSAEFTYPVDTNYHGGTAYLFNHETGMGVFQLVNADNSIGPMSVRASLGNQLVISIENTDQTVSRCIVLREGAQDGTYCTF